MISNTQALQPQTVQLVVSKSDAGMDILQFTSSLVGALAWPIVVLTFLVLFRTNIAKLIDRLRKATIAGNTIDLSLDSNEAQLEVVEEIAPPNRFEHAANVGMAIDEMPPSLSPANVARKMAEEQRALATIAVNPTAAVSDIWRLIERAMRETARRLGVPDDQVSKPIFILGKHMKGQDLFSTQIMVMLAELRKTRNLAVHEGQEVTQEAAQRYFRLAVRFIDLLEGL